MRNYNAKTENLSLKRYRSPDSQRLELIIAELEEVKDRSQGLETKRLLMKAIEFLIYSKNAKLLEENKKSEEFSG